MASRVACKFHPDANLIEDYRAGDQVSWRGGGWTAAKYSQFLLSDLFRVWSGGGGQSH